MLLSCLSLHACVDLRAHLFVCMHLTALPVVLGLLGSFIFYLGAVMRFTRQHREFIQKISQAFIFASASVCACESVCKHVCVCVCGMQENCNNAKLTFMYEADKHGGKWARNMSTCRRLKRNAHISRYMHGHRLSTSRNITRQAWRVWRKKPTQ